MEQALTLRLARAQGGKEEQSRDNCKVLTKPGPLGKEGYRRGKQEDSETAPQSRVLP